MLRNNTQVIHLSWDEIVEFAQTLSNIIPPWIDSISSGDKDSRILAIMVAENLGVDFIDIGGTKVGITNENSEFSIYKILKEDEEEGKMTAVNTILLHGEEFPPRVIPPWKRL